MPKGVYKHKGTNKGQHWKIKDTSKMKGHSVWNKGKKGLVKATDEQKKKRSIMAKKLGLGKWMKGRTGEKSNLWKGGISRNINGNWKSRLWRHKIYERDNYTCQECGIRSSEGKPVYLEAHHIKSWAKFPKERYKLLNGITLCRECHKLTDSYRGKNNKKI